jgi:hypothetical protein
VAIVDVDVKLIAWPVSGFAGEYVNEAAGTAQAGAAASAAIRKTALKRNRRIPPF